MWNFEKVFSDDGSELSTATLATALGQTIQGIYDGRFMWVTAANGIGIYEFWGASSGDEPTIDEIDDLLWARYTEQGPLRKLKLITFISISASQVKRSTRYLSLSLAPGWTGGAGSTTAGGAAITFTANRADLLVATEVSTNSSGIALTPYWIATCNDKIIVSNGANYSNIFVFDVATQQLVSVLTLGLEPSGAATIANSNLLGLSGKAWCVNTFYDDATSQRLITKNINTGTETSTNINVRPSSTRAWLANGYNGFVYMTDHNGVSVSRYDQSTAALGARIRTSAFPHHVFTTQDRMILVASDTSLLTTVDWDDDGVHFSNNTENVPTSMARDPVSSTKYWFTRTSGNQLMKYDLTSGDMFEVGPTAADWVVSSSPIAAPVQVHTIGSRTYTASDGSTRTIRPYLFVLSGSSVYLVAIDNPLVRSWYTSINGQAALVGGSQQYFGE